MGWNVRRLAISAGACAAAASLTLGQAAMASAATTAPANPAVINCAAAYVPPASPAQLTLKSTGPAVLALQQRLSCLHYWVPVSGTFDMDTMFAVWAFREVQTTAPGRKPTYNLTNPMVVDATTQALLVNPVRPPITNPNGGATRIEVNKTIQVLVLYKNNKIFLISHVSSAKYCRPDGCKWITPNGKYYARIFMPGKIKVKLGYMWNPVFYIGTVYAIHGDSNPTSPTDLAGVALIPASHGCVRIPLDLSAKFHTYIKIAPGTAGTPIYISGPAHQ